ncbi:BTAD domain-containing putative transcriptional regulator [Streptomyces sp. NPDC012888]|uniref:AfsR/SARP family transcriptional regulator n=1 Tax=Streptomyces sp. NPDC012888 TaxID=3364855 RepID=UPI00367C3EB1
MAPTRPAGAEFRLLGDLDVRLGGVRWQPPSRKPRRLLAALLLEPRRQVTKDRLLEAVWDGEPPRSATGAIQVYASQLRRALPGCGLVCSGEGYLLDVDPRSVDLHRFRQIVAGAEGLPDAERAGALRRALALFRGRPLADIGSDTLRREIEPVITEERLSTLEDLAELELSLGRSDRLVPELLRLTGEHPLRERLWEQLVRCQAGAGRRRDAAETFERARRLLREELGVEPGPGLYEAARLTGVRLSGVPSAEPRPVRLPSADSAAERRSAEPRTGIARTGVARPGGPGETGHPYGGRPYGGLPYGGLPQAGAWQAGPRHAAAVPAGPASRGAAAEADAAPAVGAARARRPAVVTPGSPAGPNMLPRDLADFTGRAAELARADALVGAAGTGSAILALTGMPGAGKTALATRVAHRARAAYPDGQLFLDLHGHSAERGPLPAHEALDLLLRMAGEPGGGGTPGPGGVALAAARWRAALTRRRMVVVLDDAADAAHIRPLLPGDSASLVIVTSRGPLAELDGAQPMPLGMLSTAEAAALFTGVLAGPGRRPERSAAEVARLCGGLPLAVRLAAGRLRQHPTRPAAELVRALRADTALDELRLGSRSVGQAFDASYRALPGPERRTFRALGLLPGPDADAAEAAALAGLPAERIRGVLEALLDRNLLEQHARDRFRLHPLLRRYARCAAHREDPEAARRAALARLAEHYLRHARVALRGLGVPAQPYARSRALAGRAGGSSLAGV